MWTRVLGLVKRCRRPCCQEAWSGALSRYIKIAQTIVCVSSCKNSYFAHEFEDGGLEWQVYIEIGSATIRCWGRIAIGFSRKIQEPTEHDECGEWIWPRQVGTHHGFVDLQCWLTYLIGLWSSKKGAVRKAEDLSSIPTPALKVPATY